MRIELQKQEIESSGIQQSSSFQIKASGHAFKILSNSLYSDKISAIIRELSANAYDSHVAAGKKNEPILLHLPTNREPWFAVTDKGVGLSHEQILSLYTTYFSSSKSGSDDFIGAFGLGSKSPFAYTSSFSILSVHDGVKRTYSAYVSDEFIPQINTMHEEKTDEPNGITVTVPVKATDIYDFSTKANDVCRYFEPRPMGLPKIDAKKYEYNDGVLRIRDFGVYSSSSWVVQGQVGYNLNKTELRSQLGSDYMLLDKLGVELLVDIGVVEVAASREELSYTPKTISALAALFSKHLAEFKKSISVDFNSITTRIEAAEWINQNEFKANLLGFANGSMQHPTLGKVGTRDCVLNYVTPIVNHTPDDTFLSGVQIFSKEGWKSRWTQTAEGVDYLSKKPTFGDLKNKMFTLSKNVVWIWIDDKKFWKAKAGEQGVSGKGIYAIMADKKVIDSIELRLGIKFAKTSDLTYTRAVQQKQSGKTIAFDVTLASSMYGAPEIKDTVKLLDSGKAKQTYYAFITHSTIKFHNSKKEEIEINERKFFSMIDMLFRDNKLSNSDYRVVLVRGSALAHVPTDWINIEEFFKQTMLTKKPKFIVDSDNMPSNDLWKLLNKYKKDITAPKVLDLMDSMNDKKSADDCKVLESYAELYEVVTGVNLMTGIPVIDKKIEEFHEAYPLIKQDHYYHTKAEATHIIKYLNLLA